MIPEKVKEYQILEAKYWEYFWTYYEVEPPTYVKREIEKINRRLRELEEFSEVKKYLEERRREQEKRFSEIVSRFKEASRVCKEEKDLMILYPVLKRG